jgi:hypothetical protein
MIMACERGSVMEVELDASSGGPNPRWKLTSDEAIEYLSRIDSLPAASDSAPSPDPGFRGFVLRSGDKSIRVYAGRVVTEERGIRRTYKDTAGIEADLVADARKRGYGDLVRT